jgi:hypothetical protein
MGELSFTCRLYWVDIDLGVVTICSTYTHYRNIRNSVLIQAKGHREALTKARKFYKGWDKDLIKWDIHI